MKYEKAIYIIGGGQLGLNIIHWAKEFGLKVVVTDRNQSAPGLSIADERLVADGADIDKHMDFAKQMCKRYKVIGIYCGGEFGLWTIYHLSNMLGLEANSRQTIENVLDKARMKRIWKEEKIPATSATIVHNWMELRDIIQQNPIYYIIKPTIGSGSRGVQIVKYDSDIETAFNNSIQAMNNQGQVIVEQYVEGRSIDANGIFLKGKFYPGGVLEKFITPWPDCLPIGGYDPAEITNKEVFCIYELLERACRSLGITFGAVKGDFIKKEDGYVVLEVTLRFHGDVSTSNTLPFGSKMNPVKFYFQYLSTGEINRFFLEPATINYATWRVICLPPGNVRKKLTWKSLSKNKQITTVWYNEKCEHKIERYTDTTKIPGYICAYGNDKVDAERALEQYFSDEKCEIEPYEKDKEWYRQLGEKIESVGFSKKSCGFVNEKGET